MRLDPRSRSEWDTSLMPMPKRVCESSSCVVDRTELMMFGGAIDNREVESRSCFLYDSRADRWASKPEWGLRACGHAVVALQAATPFDVHERASLR